MSDAALEKAADFVAEFEGFVDHIYKDGNGVPTFGYGSLVAHYPDAGPFPMSQEVAKSYLLKDLHAAFQIMDELVDAPLNINQQVALASFIYNLGSGSFMHSTLLHELNQKDYEGAAQQFERWVYDNHQVIPGLARRREAEKDLFLAEV